MGPGRKLYAGSFEVANPEAVTGLVGMTGIPARSALTGCATGNTVLTLAARDVRLGEAELAVAVGLDKHPRGAFGGQIRRSLDFRSGMATRACS